MKKSNIKTRPLPTEPTIYKWTSIVNGVKVVKEVSSEDIDFHNRCKRRIKEIDLACDRVRKPILSKQPVDISPRASWNYTNRINPNLKDSTFCCPSMALDNLINEKCNAVARGAVYKSIARGKLDFVDDSMRDDIIHNIISELWIEFGTSVLCSELTKTVYDVAYSCINEYVYRHYATWDSIKRAKLKEWHNSPLYAVIIKKATLTARELDMLDCIALGLSYESIARRTRQYRGRNHDRKMTRNEYDNQKTILLDKIKDYIVK